MGGERTEITESTPDCFNPRSGIYNGSLNVSQSENNPNMLYLKEIFKSVFKDWHEENGNEIWDIVKSRNSELAGGKAKLSADTTNDVSKKIELTSVKKMVALKLICQDKYKEEDLIYIRITDDFQSGWAFTKDSFCYGGKVNDSNKTEKGIILYKDIDYSGGSDAIYLDIRFKKRNKSWQRFSGLAFYGRETKIADFLNVAKDCFEQTKVTNPSPVSKFNRQHKILVSLFQ